MTKFPDARTEHAANILAWFMDPPTSPGGAPTYRDGGRNAALHAFLAHERHHQGLLDPTEHRADRFELLTDAARDCAEGILDTWDGWEFRWQPAVTRFIRRVESIYTYFIPAPACDCGCVEGNYPCEVGTMGAGCGT